MWSPLPARGDNRHMMIRVWEYDVLEGSAADFERVYGADGAWAELFSSSDGFEGTELFVSLTRPGRYLTVDRFRDEASWRRFQTEHRDAYLELDAQSEGLTRSERELAGPDVG
jgi:heme-degrading monooxygenase HmoA